MAVFLTERKKRNIKYTKKDLSRKVIIFFLIRRRPAAVRRHRHVSGWKDHLH